MVDRTSTIGSDDQGSDGPLPVVGLVRDEGKRKLDWELWQVYVSDEEALMHAREGGLRVSSHIIKTQCRTCVEHVSSEHNDYKISARDADGSCSRSLHCTNLHYPAETPVCDGPHIATKPDSS